MAQWIRRWCWSCAAVPWGIYLIGTAAYAETGGDHAGVDWKTLATAAIGLLSLMLGVYARSIERRVEAVERGVAEHGRLHSGLREEIARDHLTKIEIAERFDRAEAEASRRYDNLEAMVSAVHSRFDMLGVGQVHYQTHATSGDPS